MKGTRHSEEQIIAILKQGEAGVVTAELCRQHGISEQTYYRWKAKYGGMDSSEGETAEATGRREPEAEARGGGSDLNCICYSVRSKRFFKVIEIRIITIMRISACGLTAD